MKRLIIDVSSVVWMSLLAGKDVEGREVEHEGKKVWVNSAAFGYENAVSHITSAMNKLGIVPINMIFVIEGMKSKERRKFILEQYKETRQSRPPESYDEFNALKELLTSTFRNIGSQICWQDGVEADDVVAYLAKTLQGERWVLSNDGDLAQLIGGDVHMLRRNEIDLNPYGHFPHHLITVYKALVGDSSDNIPGAHGFGEKAFLTLYGAFGDEGLESMKNLIVTKELESLSEDVPEMKALQKIIDAADMVYKCWDVASLHPEWVNTLRQPLRWKAGMVTANVKDERLTQWKAQVRPITQTNFPQALQFFKDRIDETPYFCLDLETTVPYESDEWLAQRTKAGGGVDVIASTIVGCGLTFGNNTQYGFYFSVDHAEKDNLQLHLLRGLLELIPQSKITVAHNAAGFELPVLFNSFGEAWKDNGWRGFFPNMVDSRIAASYWNENLQSHGLKQMSKLLLDYEQVSYAQVTTKEGIEGTTRGGTVVEKWSTPVMVKAFKQVLNSETEQYEPVEIEVQEKDEYGDPLFTHHERRTYKMDELSVAEVLSYGLDDVFCTCGIWNFFEVTMELERTFDAFMRIEQKPMYLSALSFVQGTPIDMARLQTLRLNDEATALEHQQVLDSYLIEKGWDGTVTPVYTELTPSSIKEIVEIVLGVPYESRLRTPAKMFIEMQQKVEHPDIALIATLMEDGDLGTINDWVAKKYDGTPRLDVASPNQLTKLMYETMGLPVRLRNKATDTMRAKGIREGNPRTDDDAANMAIKMGDATEQQAGVLKALIELKSIKTRSGLYWEAYPKMQHWKTGRIHPELRQCSTNTRRHTSSNPNIQQLDKDSHGVRSCIKPHHKNAVFVSCDLAGQEIRLLADMSRDENMMSAYIGDPPKDLHSFTASMILGLPYDEFRARYKSEDAAVQKEADLARQAGKVVFFASSYGAMAPKIAEGLGIPESKAQSYLDALDRAFPRVGAWKTETEDVASSKGWVPIWGGNRRHLSELILSEDRWAAQKALRQASNARIQGAGGNQIRTIMSRIWDSDLLDKYDFQFYWPIHDELCFSVGRDDAVEAIQKVHGFMCEHFLEVMPSASSIGIGGTFGELNEIGEVADAALIEKAVAGVFA